MFKDENLINLINLCIGKNFFIELFLRPYFFKNRCDRADFYFYSAKTDMGTFF